jgi:hypothetical protein
MVTPAGATRTERDDAVANCREYPALRSSDALDRLL